MLKSRNNKLEPVIELKVLILGDINVGKSSIAERFVRGYFNNQRPVTVRTDVISKTFKPFDKMYKLNLWDTAGLERYHALTGPLFYRKTDICIMAYAVDDRTSFENLEEWKSNFMMHGNRREKFFPFIVIGNKVDIPESKRQVCKYEAQEWCDKNRFFYMEVSAKTDINIEETFHMAIVQLMLRR